MLAPIEPALLARAHPHVLVAKVRGLIRFEEGKGCRRDVALRPVPLEPTFQPIVDLGGLGRGDLQALEELAEDDSVTWTRLRVWISPEQVCEWNRSELFLKNLACLRQRIGWEIIGNREGITYQILCHSDDVPLIQAAFSGQFELCRATELASRGRLAALPMGSWAGVRFREFYPPGPYSHLMTRPAELRRSPYTTLLAALAMIPSPAIGLFQVLFIPVDPEHDWHRNVQALLTLEYKVKLFGGLVSERSNAQQPPGHDLRQKSMEVTTKADVDKPFYAAVLRTAVLDAGSEAEKFLRSLSTIGALIQHGGRPLEWLDTDCYRARLSTDGIRRMFMDGASHRPGFLVNSDELVSLVHVPPPDTTKHMVSVINMLETLPTDEALNEGTPIGYSDYADSQITVCIPYGQRVRHTHIIGRPGTGKTSVLERMIIHDVERKIGLAVLDPHGDLVDRLLRLLPEDAVERIIYLDPGDPDYVPIWNPFYHAPGDDVGRIADDLVDVFKSIVDGWGDRLEHILRNIFFALLSLPSCTLLDAYNLLRSKTPASDELRERILQIIDNEPARNFWAHDFDKYRNDDFSPPRNKLSKLLLTGTASLMLSQPDSAFGLGDVLNHGKILLVNLSHLGTQVRGILGSFLVALFRQEALRRSSIPDIERLEAHMYCDEAHRFLTDAIEDVLAEARKYGLGMTLAHQWIGQFGHRKAEALSNAGSTLIFNVDRNDAQHLTKDLLGKVTFNDLAALPDYCAIARIHQHVVRIRTIAPPIIEDEGNRAAIIARSRRLYCKPRAEVAALVRMRSQPSTSAGFREAPKRDIKPTAQQRRSQPGEPVPGPSATKQEEGASHDSF